MFFVSKPSDKAPAEYKNEVQKATYETLAELKVPFLRVDTDPAISMASCAEIDKQFDSEMVKTLLITLHHGGKYYLTVLKGDKRFDTKKFSSSLNIARVSFAPKEEVPLLLGTEIGACTIFSSLLDKEHKFDVVIDKDVLTREDYTCSDGLDTSFLKIRTSDLLEKILPYSKHKPIIAEL